MNNITTIDEYIQSCPEEHRQTLEDLRQIILASTPQETKEAINYKMPTFKYNGSQIHFALNKKHIGIYPGPSVIEHFSKELKGFKTSKGAIQIPFGRLPKELISNIVKWIVERSREQKS